LPPFFRKDTAIQRSTAVHTNGISLTANGINFHEWGAALPENFIGGFIRVHSENSWLKCSALGHPSRTGSFRFPAGQDVWRVFSSFVILSLVNGLVFMAAVGFSDCCGCGLRMMVATFPIRPRCQILHGHF
jgi:hypothetical protein